MSDVKIRNVVASVDLHQKIDLNAIVKTFVNVDYHPKRFPGLVFKLKRPKTSTLIFNTGKMVCTGARSVKLARRAVKRVVKELKEDGFIITGKPDIIIQNIVSTADMGVRVDIEGAAELLDNVMYEPGMFPGAIYRMAKPRVVILLFHSGKMVITGAKKENYAEEATRKLMALLRDEDLLMGV